MHTAQTYASAAAGHLPDEADRTYRKIAIRLMPFLVLCYFISYIDRANISFAKLQFMNDLGFSEAAYGFGAGLFFIGYSLFEVPSNIMMQRVGARRTLLRIMVAVGPDLQRADVREYADGVLRHAVFPRLCRSRVFPGRDVLSDLLVPRCAARTGDRLLHDGSGRGRHHRRTGVYLDHGPLCRHERPAWLAMAVHAGRDSGCRSGLRRLLFPQRSTQGCKMAECA